MKPVAHQPGRRRWLALAATLVVKTAPASATGLLWDAYLRHFVQPDGRVIDDQHQGRYTTSEGQAYTLFFALVAQDRERFETLLQWTDRHLAAGRLGDRLPGWRWGRRDDNVWTLVDDNAASDADLWLVQTLLEADRHWNVPRWRELAHALLALVRQHEVINLPGWGPALLPGPHGFVRGDGTVRLNPSYYMLPQLRALADEDRSGPWAALVRGLLAWLQQIGGPHGLVPDWVLYHPSRGWHHGADAPPVASYDAVRVPLWAGLTPADDPLRDNLLRACRGWWQASGPLPERWLVLDGRGEGEAPAGFLAAVASASTMLRQQALPVIPTLEGSALIGHSPHPPRYYDQVLALFAQGAQRAQTQAVGSWRFDRDGRLRLPAIRRPAKR